MESFDFWQGRDSSDYRGRPRPALLPPLASLFAAIVLAVASWPALAGPLSPEESLKNFTVPADLELQQVLTEPQVGQPLHLSWDERGRLWVVQYLQYPFPAGLKILSEDKHLRATYDKVPPPPPNHFVGRDKVSIFEDTDGDGRFDREKTFVEGLNIVTSVAHGRGGVWMLNPPYLLFWPDRDQDDVPDGDPEVHLAGFGLEDTHSCVNSLCWGPDGWLYAAQGSTVSGDVVRPGLDKTPVHSLGQLIWRYHPETKRYEIFAEGGGNAFGVEIDSQGRVFSGHNGGDTRGFHYVQGGYLQKGFTKHGPLSNPYTFGYFAAMKHAAVPRFTHNFILYDGGALPAEYNGLLLGVHPLMSHVVASRLDRDTSTFQTTDVGQPITTSDPYFRPVEIKVGPDGAIYVADFYEEQIAHLRHHEGTIDNTTGRVYRLQAKGAKAPAPFDLRTKSSVELVELLRHSNRWFRRTALRMLADRRDATAIPALAAMLQAEQGQTALEALWGLNACGGLDEAAALAALDHASPHVRLWTARLLCDERQVAERVAARLAALAQSDSDVEVRSQLAGSARRLPAAQGLPIVAGLMTHDEDAADLHVPLLIWWALECRCETERDALLALLEDGTLWQRPLVRQHLLHRVMRRFAAEGKRQDLLTCARLLKMSPDADSTQALMQGFEEAFQGRSLAEVPDELAEALASAGGGSVILSLRQGQTEALKEALATVADEAADKDRRLLLVQILGEIRQPQCVGSLLDVLGRTADDGLRTAVLAALLPYDDPRIAPAVIEKYPQLSDDVRSVAQTLLAARKDSARALVEAADAGRIDPQTVPLDTVRKLTVHRDDRIAELVARHWGPVEGATTEEMQQLIAALQEKIKVGGGNPYEGRKLFTTNCGKCHRLFGQGGQIGPDLTSFKRDDVQNVVINVVNPSAEIREGFETHLAITDDGRAVTGFLVDRDNQVLVLRGADGQNVTLRQDEIDEIAPQKKSLMPEGLLKDYNDEQVRNLFAYLRSSQPLPD